MGRRTRTKLRRGLKPKRSRDERIAEKVAVLRADNNRLRGVAERIAGAPADTTIEQAQEWARAELERSNTRKYGG